MSKSSYKLKSHASFVSHVGVHPGELPTEAERVHISEMHTIRECCLPLSLRGASLDTLLNTFPGVAPARCCSEMYAKKDLVAAKYTFCCDTHGDIDLQ